MVSKASEDLPDPDGPVNTTSLSRGMTVLMPLRLWTRAFLTTIASSLAETVRDFGVRAPLPKVMGGGVGSVAPDFFGFFLDDDSADAAFIPDSYHRREGGSQGRASKIHSGQGNDYMRPIVHKL